MSGLEDEPHGDPERAAQLMGAADGLRRRSGLTVWKSVRAEDRLISEFRAAIGAEPFDDAFAWGSRFSRSEAVAVAQCHPQATPS